MNNKDLNSKSRCYPSQVGVLLVAEPFSNDPYFSRSVVLLLESSKQGAMGVVFNKLLRTRVQDVFPQFDFLKSYFYLGGPVEPDRVFYIHDVPQVTDAVALSENIYVGGSLEELQLMLKSGRPYHIRFFMGYSGWGVGQLEDEIKSRFWAVLDSAVDLFSSKEEELWRDVLRGVEDKSYMLWLNSPLDPQSN